MRTAMSGPVGRHEAAVPCSPPTDPTGFIYPSYSTPHIGPHRQKPSQISLLQTAHIKEVPTSLSL
jgi:hypothetical protein